MIPQIPSELTMTEPCSCSFCGSARLQLADARDSLKTADKATLEAIAAWRLYLEMVDYAEQAHREQGTG